MRILVVDDEAELLAEICFYLVRKGHEPRGAHGVKEAITALEHEKFAAILADVRMVDGSGVDVFRVANMVDPSLLKIVMTGQATDDGLDMMRAQGVRHFCFKPLDLKQLASALVGCDRPVETA
jgi:DNA-binding NtrC family response regulator